MDPINPIAGNPEALNQTPTQQPPVTKPSTPPMATIQPKGRWLSSIVLLFVGLILGVGGVLAYQNLPNVQQETPVPTPTSSVTPDPTLGWKTYTNSKYKYSFKYPADWAITSEDNQAFSNVAISSQAGKSIGATHFEGKPEADKTNWTRNFVLDTNNYIMVEFLRCEGMPAPGTSCGGAVTLEDINIFNQILSTFKFTDQTQSSSNWKIYENKEFKYSFEYPSDSKLDTGTKPWVEVSYFKTGYPKNNNGVLQFGEGYRFSISTSYGSTSAKETAQTSLDASRLSSVCSTAPTISTELYKSTIGGVEAYEYIKSNCGTDNFHHYFLMMDGKQYEIMLTWASNDPTQKVNYSKTLNQILSTFKFTQ
jgi:hypothetical protein